MRGRCVAVLLVTLGIAVSASSLAAQALWTTWLYRPADGMLLHLDHQGTVLDEQSLPLTDGFSYPERMILSPDGQQTAAILTHPRTYAQQLILYNLADGIISTRFDLPEPIYGRYNQDDRLHLSRYAFQSDGKALAFSYRIAGEGWVIVVIDLLSGATQRILRHDTDAVRLFPTVHGGQLPQIQSFRDGAVSFVLTEPNIMMLFSQPGYVWHVDTGAVRSELLYSTLANDTLARTGEILNPLPDRRFPANNESVPKPRIQHNALYAFDPLTQMRYPTYTSSIFDFLDVRFIQGGERALIRAWEDEIRKVWIIVDRTGQEVKRLTEPGYDVTGTSDGYLYMTTLEDERSVLVHVETRTFETGGETVWLEEGAWHIIWADMSSDDPLLPWSQIGRGQTATLDNPVPGANPTKFPAPPPILIAGMEVQVQMLEDEFLNLRDDPSTNSNVLSFLENGVYLTLLDGPLEAEGYRWWQVSVGRRTGWVVEQVGDVQAIIRRKQVVEEDEE